MRYYDSRNDVQYPNYTAARYGWPNVSLPRNLDVPEIGYYQIYPGEIPDGKDGFLLAYGGVEWHADEEKYYQLYDYVPIDGA